MRKSVFLLVVSVCLAAATFGQQTTEGTLYAVGKQGAEIRSCPLKSTAVKADISGFISRVSVRQEFENTFTDPIEAVYVFPLSQNGAVDAMTMTVGDRVIEGKIMRREEAKQAYKLAKNQGKTASLLDQERTNIFTQSVANIMPGEHVIVEISYVETLKYESGGYEFVFPMTVAPRYVSAGVTDAARIRPPVAATRNGSDITIEVNLATGVPVEDIRSSSHNIRQINYAPNLAKISLRDERVIPNKDFILRYDVTGKRIEDAVLTHRDERGGFFTLILQPPDFPAAEDRTPKEIVFVLDTSGSMSGFPIEKAKEAMKLSLDGLYPDDTFNVITFAGDTAILFDQPVPATRANLDAAQAFLADREGGGGTEMMKAIKASLEPSDASDHLRIVCFMTDGEVGDDDEIVAEVQRHPNARVFSFGIGQSVNRALLDKIAAEGKGEAEYVALEDDRSKAARKFYERVRTPMLTDLSVDWNGMPVTDVYPHKLTDLFSAKPVILHGKYLRGASGVIRLRGKVAGQPYSREIKVELPENNSANPALSTLWARTRIDELSMGRLKASNAAGNAIDDQITNLGLDFGLMTRFTSFIAVEERVSNPNGTPGRVLVPSVLPEGMDPANADGEFKRLQVMATLQRSSRSFGKGGGGGGGRGSGSGSGNGIGFGTGSGSGSGSGNGSARGIVTGNGTTNGSSASANVVNVTASAAMVDVTSSQISTTVTTRSLQSLPRGANFNSLLRLSPGALKSSGIFQVDGSDESESDFTIDGTALTGRASRRRTAKDRSKLRGEVAALGKPAYPADAVRAKATGAVRVVVKIGSDGSVKMARAVAGNLLLRATCEQAATDTKFSPLIFNGRPAAVVGGIVYWFTKKGVTSTFLRNMRAEPPSEEESRATAHADKLHFWLFDMEKRLRDGGAASENESLFVHDRKANVKISLRSNAPSVLAKLKAAGFEPLSTSKAAITGRIAIEMVGSLADIAEVKLVSPAVR